MNRVRLNYILSVKVDKCKIEKRKFLKMILTNDVAPYCKVKSIDNEVLYKARRRS
jgi:hypothetical protein